MKKILVTGAAGFIGSYLTKKLVDNDYFVIGIDNMNDYYDVSLKENRIKEVQNDNFVFIKEDLVNEDKIREIFEEYKPSIVVNLAGSAGVRYSSINSDEYIKNNILGFCNILNISKDFDVEHFIFSSSSSIYGNNKNKPFKESDISLNQESIYASTKMCNEVIACS
ncbi:MAG: GDP-mannose 4,6-dehydratase, partial [Bacilli bacterium]|nr:GDP-mannose 4,6-dehydratase [Bacilli bacterium]